MDKAKQTIFICSAAGDDRRAQINRELVEKNAQALVDAVKEAGTAAALIRFICIYLPLMKQQWNR